MNFYWSFFADDKAVGLYWSYMADADYDGDDSTLINLGGGHQADDGSWNAYTSYEFAPRKSKSKYYGEQSDTAKLGNFPTLEAAQKAIVKQASKKLTEATEILSKIELRQP